MTADLLQYFALLSRQRLKGWGICLVVPLAFIKMLYDQEILRSILLKTLKQGHWLRCKPQDAPVRAVSHAAGLA
jgi:hypothetical protein